jgi:hypothetical protein
VNSGLAPLVPVVVVVVEDALSIGAVLDLHPLAVALHERNLITGELMCGTENTLPTIEHGGPQGALPLEEETRSAGLVRLMGVRDAISEPEMTLVGTGTPPTEPQLLLHVIVGKCPRTSQRYIYWELIDIDTNGLLAIGLVIMTRPMILTWTATMKATPRSRMELTAMMVKVRWT